MFGRFQMRGTWPLIHLLILNYTCLGWESYSSLLRLRTCIHTLVCTFFGGIVPARTLLFTWSGDQTTYIIIDASEYTIVIITYLPIPHSRLEWKGDFLSMANTAGLLGVSPKCKLDQIGTAFTGNVLRAYLLREKYEYFVECILLQFDV